MPAIYQSSGSQLYTRVVDSLVRLQDDGDVIQNHTRRNNDMSNSYIHVLAYLSNLKINWQKLKIKTLAFLVWLKLLPVVVVSEENI